MSETRGKSHPRRGEGGGVVIPISDSDPVQTRSSTGPRNIAVSWTTTGIDGPKYMSETGGKSHGGFPYQTQTQFKLVHPQVPLLIAPFNKCGDEVTENFGFNTHITL